MDVCEFRAVSDDVYFNLFRDFSWYFKRNGKNKDLMLTLAKKWALTMGLFTPFIAEELNEMLGEKDLVSSSLFPLVQEDKLNERLEAIEELVISTNSDIQKVLELSKVGKAKRITLFVSPIWKYGFYRDLKQEFEQNKDIKELIKTFTSKYKENAQEVARVIQRLVKSPVVSEVLNSLDEEYKGICDAKDFFENVYGSEVMIVKADDSDNPKAKGASPGKVAIFVE
jgi:leucyl-tRNA synthetase